MLLAVAMILVIMMMLVAIIMSMVVPPFRAMIILAVPMVVVVTAVGPIKAAIPRTSRAMVISTTIGITTLIHVGVVVVVASLILVRIVVATLIYIPIVLIASVVVAVTSEIVASANRGTGAISGAVVSLGWTRPATIICVLRRSIMPTISVVSDGVWVIAWTVFVTLTRPFWVFNQIWYTTMWLARSMPISLIDRIANLAPNVWSELFRAQFAAFMFSITIIGGFSTMAIRMIARS